MSHFIIRTRNEFYDGWVSYLLQRPNPSASDAWRTGWQTAEETVGVPRSEVGGGGAGQFIAGRNMVKLLIAFDAEVEIGNVHIEYVDDTQCKVCGDSGLYVESIADDALSTRPCECAAGQRRAAQSASGKEPGGE